MAAFGSLVVATVAAFFVTQHLKVTTPVLTGISHPEAFSPGSCQPHTHISFYLLHRSDDVSLYVVDSGGSIVRTLAVGYHMRKGVRIPDGPLNTWNGREDNGRLAPDGTYHFRVGLSNQGRSIDLTGYPVLLKTVAPRPTVTSVTPSVLPNGNAGAVIRYRGNEAHNGTIRIYRTDLPGKPRLLTSFITSAKGSQAAWDGKIHGRPAAAGTYLIGLDVTDRACNTGHFPAEMPPVAGSTRGAGVTVRYLAAQPPLDPVPAGSKALVLVDSRQHAYQWVLRGNGSPRALAHGAQSGYQLHVPLPRGNAALYELAIRSGAYRVEVPLMARASPPRHGGILVVLPALTWQGENPQDDDGDGLPDTLDAGDPVQVNRVLGPTPPAGFGDEAALLAYLDQAHLPYDLTTDVALIDGSGPQLTGHSGVVLAGSERWLPNSLATSLRSYVQGGGRVLSLGSDSLRRGVTVQLTAQGPRAVNPTAPGAIDALAARPGPVVARGSAEILVIRDNLGIFSTTSGAFPGFGSYESIPSTSPPAGPIASAAGTTDTAPAIVGYRLAHGIVVEVGLPGFGLSLARSVDTQELTRRLWTILSH
jgi:hypothetical protein